jgi:hypothetical protein
MDMTDSATSGLEIHPKKIFGQMEKRFRTILFTIVKN